MKRIFCILFSIALIILSSAAVSAVDFGCDIEPVCDAVYIEELNTGAVVLEYYADDQYRSKLYPASTTKIMTYIVVAENVADFNSMVDVTYESLADLDPESSMMGLEYHVGESFTVRDLLYGLMLPSGNDAALVLAQYVGGSVSAFVDMMNRKAAQLGCKDTHFTSPHGLHDPDHYTTLRDLAVITKQALRTRDFMEICNTVEYTPDGFHSHISTTNYMIDATAQDGRYYYPYTKGIKTGYTDEAGKCLISTAEKDGYRYLCLAMGADYSYAEDVNYAMTDTAKLYDWCFEHLATQTAYDSADVLKSLPVHYVWGNKMLDLVPESSVSALLPKDYDPQRLSITTEYIIDEALAPITKGDVYGTMTVYYDDTVIGKTNIIASQDIAQDRLNYILHRIVRVIKRHIVLCIVLFLVFVIALVLLIRSIQRRKARRRRRARARMNRGL